MQFFCHLIGLFYLLCDDMMTHAAEIGMNNDAELVLLSLNGNRDAFGRIVEQYQSLICSLAYSNTGSLAQSEDVAQETFIIAWKQLRQLREPQKLRSWLCSIARSVISRALRQETREPVHGAEMLDTAHETLAPDLIPVERAINREEEAILWRSLAQIPDIYREPLVLFYRDQQSIASVAEKLELSEDAVKQRLARGRKLLTQEVTAFVEGTLQRTNPGKAFTMGVLAALPVYATSSKAAIIGATTATGSATAKVAAGLLGIIFAPIGVLAGFVGTRIGIDSARSPRDRQFRIKMAWITWSVMLVFNVLFAGMIFLAAWYWKGHSAWITGGIIGASFCYAFLMLALTLWTMRRQRQIGLEEAAMPCDAIPSRVSFYEYRSRWKLLGWPLVHIRFGGDPGSRQPAKGWIACGNTACGILFACGGAAVGAISVGGIAVGGVAIGGCALGLLSCGGISVGIFAIGGVVLGYLGCGGAAVAWQAACGGAAVARNFAVGGTAMAQHVNDGTARAFMQNSLFFSHAFQIMDFAVLLNCLLLVPGVLYWRKQLRQEQAGR
jgi:RNA polymerase sigma factor (sigma-70 family)